MRTFDRPMATPYNRHSNASQENMSVTHIQQTLGFSFRDQALLRQALTHPSYINEHPEGADGSNQRLEFLGDAFIGLVVARELYRRNPQLDEGVLTELRSHIVRGQTLAAVARRLELGQHLLLGQGETASGGRERDSNLAAALEALTGALLLDQGHRTAQRFLLRALKPELAQVGRRKGSKDPKSQLQEQMQRQGRAAPRYEVTGTEGPAHQRRFTVHVVVDGEVIGTGQGRRKVDAERQAALEVLKQMG